VQRRRIDIDDNLININQRDQEIKLSQVDPATVRLFIWIQAALDRRDSVVP
jgi:hypothetical protein